MGSVRKAGVELLRNRAASAIRAKVTVEHGPVIGWDRYAGSAGQVIGMHTFGSSAPLKDLLKKFGFTPERVLEAAMLQIERSSAA
jgi:transketolase